MTGNLNDNANIFKSLNENVITSNNTPKSTNSNNHHSAFLVNNYVDATTHSPVKSNEIINNDENNVKDIDNNDEKAEPVKNNNNDEDDEDDEDEERPNPFKQGDIVKKVKEDPNEMNKLKEFLQELYNKIKNDNNAKLIDDDLMKYRNYMAIKKGKNYIKPEGAILNISNLYGIPYQSDKFSKKTLANFNQSMKKKNNNNNQ